MPHAAFTYLDNLLIERVKPDGAHGASFEIQLPPRVGQGRCQRIPIPQGSLSFVAGCISVARRLQRPAPHAIAGPGSRCGAKNQNSERLFRAAAAKGDHEEIRRRIATGVNIDAAADDGTTAVYAACLEGRVDALKTLLELGCSIDRASDLGIRPRDIARGQCMECIVAWDQMGASQKRLVREIGYVIHLSAIALDPSIAVSANSQ